MRVFLTGATGFIGSAIVPELINAGHEVLGLARSHASAQALMRQGAQVHLGSLEDLDTLRAGAAPADAVMHTAFDHDFSKFAMHCKNDREVIEALGSVLAGTDRPLLITSATGVTATQPGAVATEDDASVSDEGHPRASSEEAASTVAKLGCRVLVMRMPQVHNTRKQELWTYLMQTAREKGSLLTSATGLTAGPRHTFSILRTFTDSL